MLTSRAPPHRAFFGFRCVANCGQNPPQEFVVLAGAAASSFLGRTGCSAPPSVVADVAFNGHVLAVPASSLADENASLSALASQLALADEHAALAVLASQAALSVEHPALAALASQAALSVEHASLSALASQAALSVEHAALAALASHAALVVEHPALAVLASHAALVVEEPVLAAFASHAALSVEHPALAVLASHAALSVKDAALAALSRQQGALAATAFRSRLEHPRFLLPSVDADSVSVLRLGALFFPSSDFFASAIIGQVIIKAKINTDTNAARFWSIFTVQTPIQ
jgi:hypothetical protein